MVGQMASICTSIGYDWTEYILRTFLNFPAGSESATWKTISVNFGLKEQEALQMQRDRPTRHK